MRGFDYQALYCEENIFRLLEDPRFVSLRRFALFITNRARSVAVWQQLARPKGEPVLWDYHVVGLTVGPAIVWDFDTRLPWPCPLDAYVRESFLPLAPESRVHAPWFRLVPHEELRATFASDRRHMRTPSGEWSAPPPSWPPPNTGHTLERYLTLDDPIAGEVLSSVEALRERLSFENE